MKKNLCIILGILLVGSSFAKALETSVIGKKGSQNGTIFFAENGIYKEYMLLEEDRKFSFEFIDSFLKN